MVDIISGGVVGGRPIDRTSAFETAVERALGEAIRRDDAGASAMWSALANITWRHSNGAEVGYSFRAAGDLVAAIRGEGNYLDWYCSGPAALVSEDIGAAMAAEGWTWSAANG